MKKLCEIVKSSSDILITGVETDSRKIKKGNLFVAIKGFNVDHEQFIDDAIKNGAVAVVVSSDIKLDIPVIKVEDVNKSLIEILDKYYDNVIDNFKFIGITGTDGKTTTASIISKILDAAYIGTNGLIYKDYRKTLSNTTPEVCELYHALDILRGLGACEVVMEVSSEALLHGRVDNILFDVACFTNITEDHLNIHKTIENYVDSKKKLFSLVKNDSFSILNIDDKNYDYIKSSINSNIYSYGEKSDADFQIVNINCSSKGSIFDLKFKDNLYHIESPLLCVFNVYNLALSFIVSMSLGMNIDDIIAKISTINNIDGRGEILNYGQNYTLILDYAHTYNGIKNIISNMKKFSYNRIIVVTGAAGGREKEKRSKIGKYILDNVNLCIFTMDDPRRESVDDIIDDMISDTDKKNYLRIIDRNDAICKALDMAEESDLVLILGKGRDNYMAIDDKKVPYCDFEVINNYFQLDN